MTVIGWPALPCSVVWRPLMALAHNWSHRLPPCLKGNLSPPPTPQPHPYSHLPASLYAAVMIFCAMLEKDCEEPANPNSRYLYDCLLDCNGF